MFGFLPEHLLEALHENNQWKDRTNAMEAVETLVEGLLQSSQKKSFSSENATEFLSFIQTLIPDINFKISLAAIKLCSLLLKHDQVDLKHQYQPLLAHLIEKLSDSK